MTGFLYGVATCSRCQCTAHTLIDEDVDRHGHRTWLLCCDDCGMRERIDAPATSERPVEAAPADEFRFKFGRFSGMTLTETDGQPNGRKYLEWMLANNKTLAPRIAAYLRTATA